MFALIKIPLIISRNNKKKEMLGRLKQLDQKIKPFLPISKFMMTWYFLIVITLILDFFITIYELCFESFKQNFEPQKILLILMTIMFMANILISLNTSFIDNGRIINNKKAIRMRYIFKHYLLLDATVFTTAIIQLVINKYIVINFFVFVRLVKVSAIDKLICKYVLRTSAIKFCYQILKHFILLLMICHIMGSFFFFLDVKLLQLGWYPTSHLWIYSSYSYNNIVDLPTRSQYAYSFYYAVVTLSAVAYGDLTPLNPTETLYTFFGLLIPLIFYTYVFSVLHELIKEQTQKSSQMLNFRRVAKKYLEESGIQPNQIPKFINYLSYAQQNKSSRMESDFFNETAPSIRKKYMKTIIKSNYNFAIFNPLLKNQNRMDDLESIILDIAREQAYPSKQDINVQKMKNIKLFYIASGEVYEYIFLDKSKYNKIIKSENFFCQYSFFTGLIHKHFDHLFETKLFTIFNTIDLQSFLTKIKSHHMFFQSYHELRNELIFEKAVYKIGCNCFFCQQNDHFLDNCECLRHKAVVSQIIQNTNHRMEYSRKSTKNLKYHDDSIKKMKFVSILFKMNLLTQNGKQQKIVQTQNIPILTEKSKIFLSKIDMVQNWSFFEKKYSF